MAKRVLIINDLNDLREKSVFHFSLDKGLYFALGLLHAGNEVFFLTSAESYRSGICFVNYHELSSEFLQTLDVVLLVREAEIPATLEAVPVLRDFLVSPERRAFFGVKSDSAQWAQKREFREYLRETLGIPDSEVIPWVNATFCPICVQTPELHALAVSQGILPEVLAISPMAVPAEIQPACESPYGDWDRFCVRDYKELRPGKALFPAAVSWFDGLPSYSRRKRKVLVYTGRLKTDGGKTADLLHEIMMILGDFYELHLFPGSFYLRGEHGLEPCSAKDPASLQKLRDAAFPNANVLVHFPYEHADRHRYLQHADCGLDFSSSRPENKRSLAGHAKLLEYCAAGLPVVCEKNINNSYLVSQAQNGVLLPGVASARDYAEAIKKVLVSKIDRRRAREITLRNENWDLRAQQFPWQTRGRISNIGDAGPPG
ncbi:MAG: glycosyltransferase [Sulfobacillus sp.]